MPRIQPINPDDAQGKAAEMLEGVKKKMGRVPNIFATMANSPAVLDAYLGFSQAMAGSSIRAALREQIALTVAGASGCDYCASAHNMIAGNLGVKEDERQTNLQGESADEKTAAALHFARKIVDNRGWLDDEELDRVRQAGYSDAEILEIVAAVAMNLFSNYFNHIAQTDVDFTLVKTTAATS